MSTSDIWQRKIELMPTTLNTEETREYSHPLLMCSYLHFWNDCLVIYE